MVTGIDLDNAKSLRRLAEAAERQADALERIAAKLDRLTDDDQGALLRVEVVPR